MTVSESCAAPRALNPEQLLYRIAEATSGRTGDEFFRALMRGLAQALGVRLSFLTECVDQPATRVRTLALWDGDRFLNNVEYELVQTPCEQVISEGRIYFCAQGLGDIFPAERDIADSYLGVPILDTLRRQVIGHIALLNEGAMADPRLAYAVLEIFAARAGAELERRRAADQAHRHLTTLAHAGRLSALGEMAATLAHELNQPLTAIASFAQAAQRLLEAGDHAELAHALARIDANARRAGQIICHMRGYVRKDELPRMPHEINPLVESALQLIGAELRHHDARLGLCLQPGLPPVVVDAIQIQQVILNLVRNSLEALEQSHERRVWINTARRGEEVVVQVLDSGPGLPAAVAERQFEPFVTTKADGLGMGLSICKSIVEAHGGKLNYTPREGGGSAFGFTLPACHGEGT